MIGLMNVQYAIKNGTVYVLEVNPRASRTVPYVSKATGVPLPKIAVGLMLGQEAEGFRELIGGTDDGVLPVPQVLREVAGVPVQQIPRRRSGARTGDALDRRSDGRRRELRRGVREGAAQRRHPLPEKGTVFISVNDHHKPEAVEVAQALRRARLRAGGDARHRRRARSCRPQVQDRLQGERGPAQRGGLAKGGHSSSIIYTTTGAHSFTTRRRSAAPP